MKVRILIKATIFQIYQFSLKHIWSLFGVLLLLPVCFVIIFNFYNPSKSFYMSILWDAALAGHEFVQVAAVGEVIDRDRPGSCLLQMDEHIQCHLLA